MQNRKWWFEAFIVLLPFVYTASIWPHLPGTIPLHWNASGKIDRFGPKMFVWLLPVILVLFPYVLLNFLPKYDPKKTLDVNSKTFLFLKFILIGFMSMLTIYILYSIKAGYMTYPNFLTLLLGLLFIALSRLFPNLPPNYFIGIRTPWTLEYPAIWQATHRFASKLWLAGGIFIVLSSFLCPSSINFIIFLAIVSIISVGSVYYSYRLYQKQFNDH